MCRWRGVFIEGKGWVKTFLAFVSGADVAAVKCGVSVGAESSAVSLSANARSDTDPGVRIEFTWHRLWDGGWGGLLKFALLFYVSIERTAANAWPDPRKPSLLLSV